MGRSAHSHAHHSQLVPPEEVDETMPEMGPGQLLVRYFEDYAYSVTRLEDLSSFVVDALPYSNFLLNSVRTVLCGTGSAASLLL